MHEWILIQWELRGGERRRHSSCDFERIRRGWI